MSRSTTEAVAMDAEGGHTRLKELGYEQRLNRRLSLDPPPRFLSGPDGL